MQVPPGEGIGGGTVAGPSVLARGGLSASLLKDSYTSGDGKENPGGGMGGRPVKLV